MLTIYGNYGIIKQLKTRNNIRKNIVIKGDKIMDDKNLVFGHTIPDTD